MILGEMDVARAKPDRSGQNDPPSEKAWFAPHRPAAVTNFRGDSRSVSYHEDDVHWALQWLGRWGWGQKSDKMKKRDRYA